MTSLDNCIKKLRSFFFLDKKREKAELLQPKMEDFSFFLRKTPGSHRELITKKLEKTVNYMYCIVAEVGNHSLKYIDLDFKCRVQWIKNTVFQ